MNRKISPATYPIESIDLIIPKCIQLTEHSKLLLIDNIPDNTIKLDIIWDAGSKFQRKPLIASLCNQLLLAGNNKVSAKSIAEEIDNIGGYISFNHHKDHAGITIFGLQDSIEIIFDVIEKHITEGFFPNNELQKLIEIKKKDFELNEEKVSVNSRKLFTKNLFGPQHYYGKLALREDFDNVTRHDLKEFFKKRYLNTSPSFFLVGNVKESLKNKLKKFASTFTHQSSKFIIEKPVQNNTSHYIAKEGAVQTAIRIGRICIDKNHTDFIALQILSTVLGGYFGSRLMANIREDKGYTYGIGSGITSLNDTSYFFISTEVGIENRESTLREIYAELLKLQTELIPEQELIVVQNYMLGSFLRSSDGAIAMMEKAKNIQLQQLNQSYYSDYINGINTISSTTLKKVAEKYFNKADFTEISYG